MSKLRRLPLARWLVPLVAALVFIGGGSAVAAIATAGAHAPAPPPVDRLLADVAQARVAGLSGTIVQDSNLGLPQLPGASGDTGSSNLQSLVSGSHTLRVWYAGPKHVRLSLLGHFGESDVIRNGQDLWVWSSTSRTAVHRVLDGQTSGQAAKEAPQQQMNLTPQGAARMLLQKVGSTTEVTTGPNTTVAGRPAWQLVVTPRSHTTLVGSIHVAVDTATHLPLRVQVFARGGSTPAFDVGYTSFDPTAPSMSVFGFNPPAGTKVTQKSGPLLGGMLGQGPLGDGTPGKGATAAPDMTQRPHPSARAPKVVGSGWDTVVIAQAPKGGLQKAGGQLDTVLRSLPTVSGSWGSGHLLQGTLFSVLLTDSGQVVAGAVPPDQLYAALGQQ